MIRKQKTEQSNRLSISWLKKYGYLPQEGGMLSGKISWTYGLGDGEDGVEFTIATNMQDLMDEDYIKLRYTHTNRFTEEMEHMDYKVLLDATPCNYGGFRYWFLCPLAKNDKNCGRRVGVLYKIGKYFGCRQCGDIVYSAQMKGGKYRPSSVTFPAMERLESEIKRYYYNGQATRKYRRLVRMSNRIERDMATFTAKLNRRSSSLFKTALK